MAFDRMAVGMQARDVLTRRISALDGLRALAVAGVLAAHLDTGLFNGGFGVDIFFVLSGFLITTLLVAEHEESGGVHYRRFLARRSLRLMPALVSVVIASVLISLVLSSSLGGQTRSAAIPALFYFSNWFREAGGRAGMLAHTWSLSVEEQFYLVWPILLALAYKVKGRRGVLAVALVGVICSTTLRAVLSLSGASFDRIYNGTDTVADQLLIGCSLAITLFEWPRVVKQVGAFAPLALLILVLLMVSHVQPSFTDRGGLTIIAICSAIVIGGLVTSHERLTSAFSFAPAVAVGRISYGIYLWHYPLVLLVSGKVGTLATAIIVIPASIVAAAISFRLLETPVLRWRRRAAPEVLEDPVSADAGR
jgi:peptidoglycan/LPS O-acetylase OafA/YrhL